MLRWGYCTPLGDISLAVFLWGDSSLEDSFCYNRKHSVPTYCQEGFKLFS